MIVEKSAKLFIIVALFQLFDSAQVIILGALRGMQDVKIPTVIVFIAYWINRFPNKLLLWRYQSVPGNWNMGGPIVWSFVFCCFFIFKIQFPYK